MLRRSANPRPVLRRLARGLALGAALGSLAAPAAGAHGLTHADPSTNFAPPMPSACFTGGGSGACLSAGVAALNRSRARLGEPAYALPGDFATLTPAEQMFVLTDLDRVTNGLPVIPGISATPSAAASAGVHGDADPTLSLGPFIGYASNWAGGDPDAVWAYQQWMYDDGLGSGNLDCRSAGASGCWGHRHDILFSFSRSGALVGGFAAGTDAAGRPSYAMVLAQQNPHGPAPAYGYTWRQAVAAGA